MAIKIKKNEENPETPEILAEAIVRIGNAMQKLNASGLNRRAIVTLIQDQTRLGKTDIELVLNSLATLKGYYCR